MARLLPLSRGCQYAMRTVALLAQLPPGTTLSRQQISVKTGIPFSFLTKILQVLNRAGLLFSIRGKYRGYGLSRIAREITILDVITAYDGPLDNRICLLDGQKICGSLPPCSLHQHWEKVQAYAAQVLAQMSVAQTATFLRERHKLPEVKRLKSKR